MKAARDVMSADDIEIASQALRELAQLIIRDRVDSGHLEGYMRSLLNKHLIELHSACRYEAMVVARCFAGLGALDVAGYLCERACELEQTSSAFAASMSRDLRKIPMNSVSSYHRFSPIRGRRFEFPVSRLHSSWIPELIAAIVCTAVSIFFLASHGGDFTLRMMGASGYGLFAFIYANEAVHTAWRNAHPHGQH